MAQAIPEGYELLSGRGRDNALKALALAEERGIDPSLVRTSPVLGGFLIPVVDGGAVQDVEAVEIDGVTEKSTVAEIDAFAAEFDIDLGGASTKADKLAAINAEIENRTAALEEGGL